MIKTIDFKPLIKKRKGILAIKIKARANKNNRAFVITLLAQNKITINKKSPSNFALGSIRWRMELPGTYRPKIILFMSN